MHYHILIADDHPLFRRALEEAINVISEQPGNDVDVSHTDNFNDALELLRENQDIDLVLLDLKMPGNEGLLGLMQIRREFPQIGVAVVSATEDLRTIANAMREGAMAYIPKSIRFEWIQAAIQSVLAGNHWLPESVKQALEASPPSPEDLSVIHKLQELTPQQMRVLIMIGKGYLNKQIADELGIKETTIKTHVSEILRKLDIKNRTQAAMFTQYLEVVD